MNIFICIKQVPAMGASLGETGDLDRSRGEKRINPGDLWALEAGLRLREALGGRVTAVTMGPASAKQVLRDALAMGADQAALLTDRAFSGGDVYATAYTLSQGTQRAEVQLPALLAVGPLEGSPRLPSLRSRLQAKTRAIRILGLSDLEDGDPAHYGRSGSHTRVRQVKVLTQERMAAAASGPDMAWALCFLSWVSTFTCRTRVWEPDLP